MAHHSVLIVEVFGSIDKTRQEVAFEYGPNEHRLVSKELLDIRDQLPRLNKLEAFH